MPRVTRRAGACLLMVLEIAFVVACQGAPAPSHTEAIGGDATASASATPGPTSSPTSRPTPTANVAALALEELRGVRAGRMRIEGELRLGDTRVPVSGELEVSGSDYRRALTVGDDDSGTTTEEVSVRGERFESVNGGPFYLQEAGGPAGSNEGNLLHALPRLIDRGSEDRNGRHLHRLEPPRDAVIPPSVLGLTAPEIEEAKTTLTVYAEDDGTVVELLFDASWQQKASTGTQPVELTLSYELVQLAGSVEIERPAEVWTTHVSKRYGYSIGYPDAWEVDEAEENDDFLGPDGIELVIYMEPDGGTLNRWATDSVIFWQEEVGERPEANEPIQLDDEPGRLLTYHADYEDVPTFLMNAMTVREGRAYDLIWYSVPGAEADDRTLFESMLATFRFR
jgi:hypothetical protein